MKLTKTELKLIATMTRWGGASVCMSVGFGSSGGVINAGKRDMDAALALIEKGVAVEVGRSESREVKRGNVVRFKELTIKLAETVEIERED